MSLGLLISVTIGLLQRRVGGLDLPDYKLAGTDAYVGVGAVVV